MHPVLDGKGGGGAVRRGNPSGAAARQPLSQPLADSYPYTGEPYIGAAAEGGQSLSHAFA